jgi:hypothetical protein
VTLVNDIVSVENFVKSVNPTALTFKQTPPKEPVPNTFVIRFQSESRESETALHWRTEREYQIIYFGADAADVLTKMDALSKALYQTLLIPIDGSLRYIRVESFSLSQPFLTDNKLFACIGVLSTTIREARDQATYEKIMHVNTRFI